MDEAAIALQDDCLGFTLARDFDPREIGLLYYIMASSQTLGDALKRVARYSQITNEALVVRYREGRGSHPGIKKIVKAAAAINPKIHIVAGGSHLVIASDDVIAKAVTALKDTFKVESIAPGHCTGEPTFAALKNAFGDRYLYAGLGTTLPLRTNKGSDMRRGEGPALQQDDLTSYRRLARREDPFGILRARSMQTKTSQL